MAQLKAMNPDYNGKESHQIENGAVVQLALDAESIRRLAPVAALRKLQKLSLTAPRERQAALGDLSPLTGLQLTALDCNSTQVTDLSPLSGQPLEDLNVRACHKLLTLAPLKGMKLRRLNISNNMALADFSALQDMPLESFEFIQTRLRDLELLRGAPLQRVRFFMTEVRDLSPLRGAPLKDYEGDAGLLNDPRNLDVLRSVKTLERIQGKTAAEFWKQVDAQPPPPPVVERLPEAGDAAWQKAVNLLPLIDPAKDAVEGVWRTAGGTLKVGAGKASRVQLPYLAPEEYDFRMEFARQSGTGAVWQVLNQGGKSFTWCLAGWDGKWMGFESIGGKVVNQNVSGVAMAQNLVNGRRYVSLVEVRKDGVKAYLDGRFVTAWKTDYADMSLDPALRLRDARALGLGAGQSALTVYQVAVREVTGQGTLARTAPVAQTPTVADADRVPEANDAAWKNSLDVLSLIEPERDTVRGEWARDFEKLVGDRNAFAAIEIPYRPPEEYDYRVEFTPTKRGNIGALHLAKAAHAFTFNFFGAGGALFGFEGVNGELIQSNQTARRMVPVEVGKRYVVLVEVRNNEVRAFLNTCFVTAWKTDYSDLKTQERWQLRDATLLGLGCQSRVEFHGARVREVTGKGAFLRQPPPAAAGAEGAAPGARIRRD